MKRVTDVIARVKAGSIDVCRQGDKVALHIGTPQGRMIIMLEAREFNEKCRGKADHNGIPLGECSSPAPVPAKPAPKNLTEAAASGQPLLKPGLKLI